MSLESVTAAWSVIVCPQDHNTPETDLNGQIFGNLLRKRMVAGVTPGLQNRRAASSMSPVCSTHTRFRHFSVIYRTTASSQCDNRVRLYFRFIYIRAAATMKACN